MPQGSSAVRHTNALYLFFSSPPYALQAPPISFFSILSPENYWAIRYVRENLTLHTNSCEAIKTLIRILLKFSYCSTLKCNLISRPLYCTASIVIKCLYRPTSCNTITSSCFYEYMKFN